MPELMRSDPQSIVVKACERIAWYAERWGTRVFHRQLKSVPRIENRLEEVYRSIHFQADGATFLMPFNTSSRSFIAKNKSFRSSCSIRIQ